MKIAIVGIGGVGGYYGGKLAKRYATTGEHEILFLARGDHLTEMRRSGLSVTTDEGVFTAMPTLATDNPDDLGLLDLVLFCVKTYDLENTAQQLIDNVHGGTTVITLLNGVDNPERLQSILSKSMILNGGAYINSFIQNPGCIKQVGELTQFFFGPESDIPEKYQYIEDLLRSAGIAAELATDISLQVWTKYIFVGPLGTISSVLQEPVGAILENDEHRQMLKGLMEELRLVARNRGIALHEDIVSSSFEKLSRFPYDVTTSMQRDFKSGKKTELETFAGYIVRSGNELGVATPLYSEAYNKLLERSG